MVALVRLAASESGGTGNEGEERERKATSLQTLMKANRNGLGWAGLG
jgi:hypothetical protein